MGTPDFAVPSLQILLENGYDIVAVVTATDKQGGRKGLLQSAVKQFAVSRGLRVLQPEKLKNPEFIAELQALNADLQIVVAFRMLPEIIWAMPRLGTMNLHGSLLPRYRGAAPIHWAVINGETETGCTTFLLKHEIDTGDILMAEKLGIGENDTTGEVHDKMMHIGANLVLQSVRALESGKVQPQPQANLEATHAPKLFHETCMIDFSKTVAVVHNQVRGLSPFPTAWTMFRGSLLKIYKTSKNLIINTPPSVSGENWQTDGKNYLRFKCADGFIEVLELQLEGKKKLDIKSFLNGYKF